MRADWLAEAETWIHQHADVAGEIQQIHVRPWSTVLRAPTPDGNVFFKACAPVQAHEVPLTVLLAGRFRHCVLPVLASDEERAWMLLPDAGVRLSELVHALDDAWHWELALPIYARLQGDLVGSEDELLALGVPDRRLRTVVDAYDTFVEDYGELLDGGDDPLNEDELRRLRKCAPRFAEVCGGLSEFGLPETLEHADLHKSNVFLRDGSYVLFDWGDSCVAHPFLTPHLTLSFLRFDLGLDDDHEVVARLRDAYLRPWTRFAPRVRLVEAFELARPVYLFSRALSEMRFLEAMEPESRLEHGRWLPEILRRFLAVVE